MKIYTRTGDDGTTSLSGGRRVPKHHPRVEAYGSIDELIAWIGLLRDFKENDLRKEKLIFIQEQLMACAVTLAIEKDNPDAVRYLPDDNCISIVEGEIDSMEVNLRSLKNFIVPGGHILVSYCHIARCVCRRAERAILILHQIEETPEIVIKFINRLSDYLFVLSRQIALELDIEEISWSV
jgi:cob(I)alamin adenosyltransferase